MPDDFRRVQIIHLGTGITNLRRVVSREELRMDIEFALLRGGLSGVPYSQRDRLKALIVSRIVEFLCDVNHIETYRNLPDTGRPMEGFKWGR